MDEQVERRETHVGLGQRGHEAPQRESKKATATSSHLPNTMVRPATSAGVRLDLSRPDAAFDSRRLVLVGGVHPREHLSSLKNKGHLLLQASDFYCGYAALGVVD